MHRRDAVFTFVGKGTMLAPNHLDLERAIFKLQSPTPWSETLCINPLLDIPIKLMVKNAYQTNDQIETNRNVYH